MILYLGKRLKKHSDTKKMSVEGRTLRQRKSENKRAASGATDSYAVTGRKLDKGVPQCGLLLVGIDKSAFNPRSLFPSSPIFSPSCLLFSHFSSLFVFDHSFMVTIVRVEERIEFCVLLSGINQQPVSSSFLKSSTSRNTSYPLA